ncbi:MAG: VOC family protein [Bacteroidota bacterium]
MEKAGYKIEGMTMAITNMRQMLDFYSNTFNIQFTEREMYGSRLYSGVWGGLNLLFCPAEIARNTADQNRHQFDIVVSDLHKTIEITTKYGGKTMGEMVEDEYLSSIGIYDPDENSILFKQIKD